MSQSCRLRLRETGLLCDCLYFQSSSGLQVNFEVGLSSTHIYVGNHYFPKLAKSNIFVIGKMGDFNYSSRPKQENS